MTEGDGSLSFYFFEVNNNLLFLSTKLYLYLLYAFLLSPVASRNLLLYQCFQSVSRVGMPM